MSSEYANLGFRVDSSGLVTGDQRLRNLTKSGRANELQNNAVARSIGGVAAALLSLNAISKVKDDIFSFDLAMKGLQATTRVGTKAMKDFEEQARSLGAISKFSATEAAQAQRFLAMAGFDTNEILAATPSILKLATAGELSLAEAADIASNALGGLQLPVDQLNRVIDVMAETSASANTDIKQLAQALKTAAPIATAAGVEIEELSAVIGSLSDSGIQAERAGTGVLGIIRQLSNITPTAEQALAKYGLTTADLSIKSHGLTGVMKTLNGVNLDAGDAIQIFGSEAATAGLITAAFSDHVANMTEKYRNATGAADAMSNIMSGSLTAGLLGVGSALSEVALQAGDAGLAGGMKEAMLATTGFIHVFTGMLPEFAIANNLTADYVSTLNDVADVATVTTGALGGMFGLLVTTKVASLGAAGAMGILNAVMLANPFVLAVTAISAVAGALYTARNMALEFGGETVKVKDIVTGAFNAISDGFNIVQDSAIAAYSTVSDFFSGTSQNSEGAANDIVNNVGGSFVNIYEQAKSLVNGVIATFVTLGKSIGVIAASITMAFSNSFENVKSLGSALSKDLSAVLDGDFSASNLSETIKKVFSDPLKMTFSELGKVAADSFNTDYIGDAAGKLSDIVFEAKAGLELYTLAAKKTREENEALAESSKKLGDDIEWMLGKLDAGAAAADGQTASNPFELSDVDSELDSLIDKVDNFGGAWTRTGNIIADAFGDIGDAMNSYMQSMDELSSMQKELDEERKKSGADSVKLDKLQQEINEKRVSAELSGYKSLADGAAGMFSEKTAAAKAFTAISQVLAVTEMALSYQKMAASTTEAGVHVANETTKQGANALTAITSAFAAPFPVNFAMGAAMIGIMASLLGGAFGGGGGGSSYEMPEDGGTGTVLGDSTAQSASISGATERFEDIQVDQLSELMGIRNSMTKLSAGIQNIAKSFVTGMDFSDSGYAGDLGAISSSSLPSLFKELPSFVDPILSFVDGIAGGIVGSFSSKKKKLIDSGISFVTQTMQSVFEGGTLDANMYQVVETTKKKLWGLSKSSSTNTDTSSLDGAINQQMGDIFGYIGESVISAAQSLGLDAKHIITTGLESLSLSDALNNFVIDIGNVSFADKTGDEIQEELEAIFSQQADLMSEYLVPSIKEYQQVGEGAFETLQRVAYEQAVFNDSLDRTGMNLKSLSSALQIDIAQSIIGLVGSVEQFSELSNEFFSSFYSEADQLDYLKGSLTDVFDDLGLSLSTSKDAFRNLVTGIDLTTTDGQALYATLLQISPAMSEYLDALDDLANDKLSLQIDLLNAQGESEQALALSREMQLAAADSSLHAIMKQIWATEDATAAEEKRAQAIIDAENAKAAAEAEALSVADESASLNIRLLEQMGESEQVLALQRAAELSAVDESNKSILERIYALEDEAAAQAKADEVKAETASLNIRLLEAQGKSEQVLALQRAAELAAVDLTNRATLQRIYALEDEAAAQAEASELASNRSDLYIQLLSAQGREEDALALTRQKQLDALDPTIRALQMQIWAEEDLTSAREAALSDMSSQINTLENAADGFKNVSDAITDLIFDTYNALDSNAVTISDALDAARAGDFSKFSDINVSAEIGDIGNFASLQDYNFARDVAFSKLAEIQQLSLSSEDVAERAMLSISDNMDVMSEHSLEQVTLLGDISSQSAKMTDAINSINLVPVIIDNSGSQLDKALLGNSFELGSDSSTQLESILNRISDFCERVSMLDIEPYLSVENRYESSIINNAENLTVNNTQELLIESWRENDSDRVNDRLYLVNENYQSNIVDAIKSIKLNNEDKQALEIKALFEQLNKSSAQNAKILKHIEQNTYEAIK